MLTIQGRNVNDMLPDALWRLKMDGIIADSRNGAVRKFPYPVLIRYDKPMERVLFAPERDANPFFHLFESVWMLAGRNDVVFPSRFASQMKAYSDDGATLHGAYGFRWREHFGEDQLTNIVESLQTDPTTRRLVLGMWDAYIDPPVALAGGKDVPCNTHAYFAVRNGKLDLTVCNRSNDLVWGCFGANAVHMSILHEYVARGAGLEPGHYYQFTNDLHLYEQHFNLMSLGGHADHTDPYVEGVVRPSILFGTPGERKAFDDDCVDFCIDQKKPSRTLFFQGTVKTMYAAWKLHTVGLLSESERMVQQTESSDWRKAGLDWLLRRHAKKLMVVKR
jgi:hypothetical protein